MKYINTESNACSIFTIVERQTEEDVRDFANSKKTFIKRLHERTSAIL